MRKYTPEQIEAARKTLTTLAAFWDAEMALEEIIGRDVTASDIEEFVSSTPTSADDAIALLSHLKTKKG